MNRSLILLSVIFLLALAACDSNKPDGPVVVNDWLSLKGYDFKAYVGHFDDIIHTDESANNFGIIALDGDGDGLDWQMHDYAKGNKDPQGSKDPADARNSFTVSFDINPYWATINGGTQSVFTDTAANLIGAAFLCEAPGRISQDYIVVAEDLDNTIVIVLEPDGPVIAQEVNFTATLTPQKFVELKWMSESESHMLGYNIYRSDTNDHTSALLITPVMIPATNTPNIHVYELIDREVALGASYYYWMVAIDSGHNINVFGPVFVEIAVDSDQPPVFPALNAIRPAYPNPANQGFILEIDLIEGVDATILILNRQYSVVKKLLIPDGFHGLRIDSSNFAPGLYRVFMHTSDGQYSYGDLLVSRP